MVFSILGSLKNNRKESSPLLVHNGDDFIKEYKKDSYISIYLLFLLTITVLSSMAGGSSAELEFASPLYFKLNQIYVSKKKENSKFEQESVNHF
jgi:hypothetical protein